mmetsp:Transcript_22895/g.62125  ORF Transcript_22895/g.62125 Transcript_22895/m.62125 type:complete len:232 (-) Transcript_22895:655-1350(-)
MSLARLVRPAFARLAAAQHPTPRPTMREPTEATMPAIIPMTSTCVASSRSCGSSLASWKRWVCGCWSRADASAAREAKPSASKVRPAASITWRAPARTCMHSGVRSCEVAETICSEMTELVLATWEVVPSWSSTSMPTVTAWRQRSSWRGIGAATAAATRGCCGWGTDKMILGMPCPIEPPVVAMGTGRAMGSCSWCACTCVSAASSSSSLSWWHGAPSETGQSCRFDEDV